MWWEGGDVVELVGVLVVVLWWWVGRLEMWGVLIEVNVVVFVDNGYIEVCDDSGWSEEVEYVVEDEDGNVVVGSGSVRVVGWVVGNVRKVSRI